METLNDKMVPLKPFHEILSEIQAVLKDENARVMAKVGMNLGQRWAQTKKEKGLIPASIQELFDWIADYLQNELFISQKVAIIPGEKSYIFKFGVYDSDRYQCLLCCSHLVKQKGGQSACPVSNFMMGTFRVFKNNLKIKRIQLEKIQKPVSKKPGACEQIFSIEAK